MIALSSVLNRRPRRLAYGGGAFDPGQQQGVAGNASPTPTAQPAGGDDPVGGSVTLPNGQVIRPGQGSMVGSGLSNTGTISPWSNFQATGAQLSPDQNYTGAIDRSLSNAQQNYDAQGKYIGDLSAAAAGQGPSAAQAMLGQATNRNIQNTASMVAGNKSLSPAQAARIQIEGGAAAQGEAAGQAATLRANEQLGARSLLGQALGQQSGSNLGALSTAAGAQQGQQQLAMQNALGAQGLNEGVSLANLQANLGTRGENLDVSGQWMKGLGALAGGAGAGAAAFSDKRLKKDVKKLKSEALPGVKDATWSYKGEPAGAKHRGPIAQDVEKKYPELVGNKAGYKTVPSSLMKYAGGGRVPPLHSYLDSLYGGVQAFDEGGEAGDTSNIAVDLPWGTSNGPPPPDDVGSGMSAASIPKTSSDSSAKTAMKGAGAGLEGFSKSMSGGDTQYGDMILRRILGGPMGTGSIYADGGRVDALVSPQEVVVPSRLAKSPAAAAEYVSEGKGTVPGKAKVKGDSKKNDTVRAKLSPGSVVIPRSITQGENAPERAASFVASIMGRKKRYMKGGKVLDMSEGGWV